METAKDQRIQCVRSNSVNDHVVETREADVVEMWVCFNTEFRPHAALFVNGVCRHQGNLTQSDCDAIAARLAANPGRPEPDLFS